MSRDVAIDDVLGLVNNSLVTLILSLRVSGYWPINWPVNMQMFTGVNKGYPGAGQSG